MTDQPAPNWDALPHDPLTFFALEGDFDPRDLKRSYNRLIRQFKPEKFPDEFQRIRAAYESLSDGMRYGLINRSHPRPPSQPTFERNEPESSAADDNLPAGASDRESLASDPAETEAVEYEIFRAEPVKRTLVERLERGSESELYDQLRNQEAKSAEDYVALAVLSDVVTAADESFADWLLLGLTEYGNDWGLSSLLRDFLATSGDIDEIISLLPRVAVAARSDRFRYLSEPAWDYLLRHAEFEQFRQCFDDCARELGRAVDDSELVFYIHVLRMAVWKADPEWVQSLVDIVEDHFHDLSGWSQQEFELVSYLVEYQSHRAAFVRRGPCCQRIDQAMQDWSLLGETEGDQSVLDCHYMLSARGQQILQEFPDHSDDLSYAVLPWTFIADDVAQRTGEPEQPNDEEVHSHARDFMIRVLRRKGRTVLSYLGRVGIFAVLAWLLIVVATSGSLAVRALIRLLGEGRFLAAGGDSLMALVIFLVGFAAAIYMFRICRRAVVLNYPTTRGELLKLLRVAPMPLRDLAQAILAQEDTKFGDNETIDDTGIIVVGLLIDPAMEFFAQAQMGLQAAMADEVVDADIA